MGSILLHSVTWDGRTIFLIATNIILGLGVLLCCGIVIRILLKEVAFRKRARALRLSKLGVTIADGGRRIGQNERLFVTRAGTLGEEQIDTGRKGRTNPRSRR
jgi:hypothetical protein